MTPPPSDADKPGSGGPKPDAVPPKSGQPGGARPDPKAEGPSPVPPVAGTKPASSMTAPASQTGPRPSAAPSPAASGPTSPKPATDPVVIARAGDAKAEPGKSGPGPASSVPPAPAAGTAPAAPGAKAGPAVAAASPPDATKAEPPKTAAPEAPKTSAPAAPKTAAPAGEPAKPAADGGAPKVEPGRSDPGRSGPTGPGPQAGARPGAPAAATAATAGALTDGPILDLKAKRVPDPPAPGAAPVKDAAKEPPKDVPKGPVPGAGTASAKPDPMRSAPAEPAPPVPTAKPSGGGFGSIAASGLLGGLVGAGLLFAVGKSGVVGGNDGARLSALDQKVSGQISTLDQRIGGLAPRDALSALDKRVATAEATAKQALDKQAAAPAPVAAPADGQTAGQLTASTPPPAVPADLIARLDSLDQRVAALQEEPGRDQPAESRLGVAQGGAQGEGPGQIAALDARVKALEGDGKAPAAATDVSQKIAALQGDVESRTKANAETDAALAQRVDGLQQALDARTKAATEAVQAATQASRTATEAGQVQAAEAAKAVDRRLQEQSETIAALDRNVAQRAEASTVQAALRVVVADRVVAALASGMPYAEPLATLRRLDPGADARAAALAPFAEKGAPTAGQLADAFRPITDRIAAKRRAVRAQNAAETGDFRAKLLSMADGLVQVRKVDAAAPEAAADPEGQVQAALDRGDLAAASAAFAALTPEAQGEAGDFGARLKARAQAGEAARTVLADAFKALPTPTPTPAPGR